MSIEFCIRRVGIFSGILLAMAMFQEVVSPAEAQATEETPLVLLGCAHPSEATYLG